MVYERQVVGKGLPGTALSVTDVRNIAEDALASVTADRKVLAIIPDTKDKSA